MKGFLAYLPHQTSIHFMRHSLVWLVASGIFIVLGIGSLFYQGLNLGIDFRGGILLEVGTKGPADIAGLRKQLGKLDIGEVNLQSFGADNVVLIRIQKQAGEEEAQAAAVERVKQALGSDVEIRRQEFVGPQVGRELVRAGLMAFAFAIGGILIYIWFRFEWQFAMAAIMALLHDTIATIGLFSLTQMEFNLSTVAAVLMIAGYSINDTVVVFDRMRENLRKYKREPLPSVIDRSLNDTLTRTTLTSGTTLLALVALMVFGGEVIRGFVIALVWGIATGTFSSIYIAAPTLILFKLRPDNIARLTGEKKAVASS